MRHTAANTIGYSDDRAIISAGFPVTREVMLDAGFSITSVDMDAIMQADGSLSCLSVFTDNASFGVFVICGPRRGRACT